MKARSATIAKRQLPRLAIDATPYNYQNTLVSPSSSLSSAHVSVTSTSVDTPFSAGICHVLCLYDFDATDPDQLSFRKNEILDIVKQEDSGWWAALRHYDGTVGWIPSAYVDPISEQTAEHWRAQGHDVRIQANLERFHLITPMADERSPYGMGSPSDGIRGYEWLPLTDAAKNLSHATLSPNRLRFPNDVSASAVNSPLVVQGEDAYSPGQVLTIPDNARNRAAYPPSPSTPMPRPPLEVSVANGPRSAPIRSSTSPFPQSPTPTKSPATALFSRQFRRRPVLIDDSTSLSRLSTLFESSSVDEVDFLASSPVVAESIDAYARVARAQTLSAEKVKQITGDEEAQVLYSAKVAQGALPWFLKPDYVDGDIQVEFDGTISAGTLPALVERLTIEHFSAMQEKQFRHTFLMTYRTFGAADEVFDLLLTRYHMMPPPSLTAEEIDLWKQKKLGPAQKRVLGVFATWLEQHRLVEDEPPVTQKLQEFLLSVTSPTGNKVIARQLMKILERLTFAVSPDPNARHPNTYKHWRKKSSRDDLFKIDASMLADHLYLYERKLYSKVHARDCLDYIKRQPGAAAEPLISFCKTHDRLANWVKWSVLNVENVGRRAYIVDVWIKVAERCRAINAFSSLSAVIAALTSTVLTSLTLTWAHVDRAAQLDPLAKFNEPTNNTFLLIASCNRKPMIPAFLS